MEEILMYIEGNIKEMFNLVNDYWSPRIVGDVNDDYIKIAKFKGELVWHDHENEDEMFYVVKGSFDLHLEDKVITLNEGDFYVVKKGITHKPSAKEECWVMLIEKKDTKHTGNVDTPFTKTIEDQFK
jgi:mannose-6-phosphate isomerase-like protein (cupin superfamily)